MSEQWWMMFEDDQVDVMSVQRAMRGIGKRIDIAVAPNGWLPLDQLRECLHERGGTLPELILLDINLPLGSGHEAIKALKADAEACRIPVVVLSTSDHECDVAAALAAGAAGYFVKPVSFDAFQEMVRIVAEYWELGLKPRQRACGGAAS